MAADMGGAVAVGMAVAVAVGTAVAIVVSAEAAALMADLATWAAAIGTLGSPRTVIGGITASRVAGADI